MYKTINSVVEDDLCTGCGTCVSVCPRKAVTIEIDKEKGLYIPKVISDLCSDCGICFEVCPGHEVDFHNLNLEIFNKDSNDIFIGNYLNCYIGYSNDYNIRYNSASGGLITAILIYALREKIIDGVLVTRMKKNNPLEPEPFIARTIDEVIEAAKSKYCPVAANIALKDIIEAKEGEKFWVVGLPCHIHGIRKAQKLNSKLRDRITLCLGIVCNHAPTFRATDFMLKKYGVKKQDVHRLNYRGEGWPGGFRLNLKNGIEISSISNEYWAAGFGAYFYSNRCTVCCDQTCELSDISFADAWLPELKEDHIGTSICVTRNHFAEKILQDMVEKSLLFLDEADRVKFIRTQSKKVLETRKKIKSRMTIMKLFKKSVPNYNTKLIEPGLIDYINSLILFYRITISKKEYLWSWIIFEGNIKMRIMRYIKRNDKFLNLYRVLISKKNAI